jgi:hypothetical protein
MRTMERKRTTGKCRWITIRAEQSDVDKLQALAENAGANESAVLRAIIRTATLPQVEKGIKLGQRRRM